MQETYVQSLGWEDPLEKGNGNPLQYSCLENPIDGEAWQATESDRTQRLNNNIYVHIQLSPPTRKKRIFFLNSVSPSSFYTTFPVHFLFKFLEPLDSSQCFHFCSCYSLFNCICTFPHSATETVLACFKSSGYLFWPHHSVSS